MNIHQHQLAVAACAVALSAAFGAQRVACGGTGGGAVHYAGLEHTPLGNATLDAARDTNCLVVSNIGSSGIDGVRVNIGEGQGFLMSVDIGPSGALPTGAEFHFSEFTEIIAGKVRLPHFRTWDGHIRYQSGGGGNAELLLDLSYYSPSQTQVRLYLGSSLVDVQTWSGEPPGPVLTGALGTSTTGEDIVLGNIGSSGKDGVRGDDCLIWDIKGSDQMLHLSGRPSAVLADRIEIDVTTSVPRPTLSRVEATAANINSFSIFDEALGMWGLAVRSLNSGHMSTTGGGDIVLGNIGASGDDGAAAEPWSPDSLIPIRFALVDVASVGGTSATGWRLEVRVNRIELARMRVEEGRLRAEDVGGSIALSSYFEPSLGSFAGTVVARREGVQVDIATGVFAGQVALINGLIQWPSFVGIEHEDIGRGAGGQVSKTHTYRFDPPVPVVLGSSPRGSVLADEIVVLNGNSPGTAEIDFVEVAGGGDSSGSGPVIVIDNITLGPAGPLCPADIASSKGASPDGVVNLFDLLLLLDNWGTSGAGAAISEQGGGSTVVDLFDLLAMLDAWGDC